MPVEHQLLADEYQKLLEAIYHGCSEPQSISLPPELQVQSWWNAGYFPQTAQTQRHGEVRIIESGRWNRCSGPDFTHAEIEINGQRHRGCIEIDPRAQDWEAHGHGGNPAYDDVVLHVVLTPPPAGWYTRNSQHKDIPILHLPPEFWNPSAARNPGNYTIPRCRKPLAEMSAADIIRLLQAAAAYRKSIKQKRFNSRVKTVGESQAWYEAWATTLGYHANKEAMRVLAMRAPIAALSNNAEAILLGTAGFLVPVLPAQTCEDAREYHRTIWDSWWLYQEQFALSPERQIKWNQAPSRPLNHPQRRVAALASSVGQWKQIQTLLNTASAQKLVQLLTKLSHPFWDKHYTLSSAPMKNKAALVGKQRAQDFLINHVLMYDPSPEAWELYTTTKGETVSSKVQRTAAALFGERKDLESTLKLAYAQQALMQIDADFCDCNSCTDCVFPSQLSEWAR